MLSMLFSSFVISTANCSLLSDITLSGNPYSFYILFLNNLTNPSAKASSVMATKCAIFDNLSYTSTIMFFSVTSSSLVIKSTFIIFLGSHLLSTFLLVPPFYYSFFGIDHSHPYTSLYVIIHLDLNIFLFLLSIFLNLIFLLFLFSFSFLGNEKVHDYSNMTSHMK